MLLKLNFSTSLFQLRFDLFCFFFGNALFNCFGSAINQILGLFQTQAGDILNGFNYLQLSLACVGENHVERGLLSSSGSTTFSGSSGNSNSSSSGLNSVFVFQNTSKFVYFLNCQVYQLLS